MPNKNYLAGRRFEYLVKKDLEGNGTIVLRTAGSHGLFDLVAIHTDEGSIWFIQCKVVKTSVAEAKLEKEWADNPPLGDNGMDQVLAIKVKGKKGYRLYWA